jgi:peroxiredoxin
LLRGGRVIGTTVADKRRSARPAFNEPIDHRDEVSEKDLTSRRWVRNRTIAPSKDWSRCRANRATVARKGCVSMSSTNGPIADHLLRDRVAEFHASLAKQAPAEVITALVGEIDGVVRSGAGAKAPRVGEKAPPFTLPDVLGNQVSLDSLLKMGPVVITFYRGQWCPYCDLQLRAYQGILERIKALGASLVAISPQTPDEGLSTAEKRNLEFSVLTDAGNRVARTYGLVWKVPAGLDAIWKGLGVNLAASNGDTSNELPVPGTFVLGADGRIAFGHANADWRDRLEPAELLRSLEKIGRGQ